ncbi:MULTISPECIES: alpha/beta hydrolase [Bacillaceae]|uniref:Alpha/beta hydrolase n=1 Tax=Niallia circulans TaxID=1397 RepID=A0A941GMA5_NIACI|nr:MULTISPECIES: alpha/beta hydrolase-fold protein [Bacillaceae]MCB5236603.1 alpha/beta hydrolase [Niallia circulans]MDU1845471.1 alpha/beta hydrolase-fold protein [Niallia nealsonii]MED3795679.1 alpha/beta hydrolase-fold protein [Niallia alba]UTI44365.1 alpha/beta hydrolase-fold protein [Niallia sp. RD1]
MEGKLVEAHIQTRSLSIYMPPSYNNSVRNYPVIYVQDGGSLFHSVLSELEELFSFGLVEEVMIVGIEPMDRLAEYTPWFSPSISSAFPPFKGEGREYLTFISQNIKPYIDRHFRTKTDRQHTGMMGASLGGLISVYAMYEFADYFSKFGIISPSLWYPNILSFVQKNKVGKENRVFLYVGEEEGKRKNNIQREMVNNVLVANKIFLRKLSKDNYQFVLGKNADHQKKYFVHQFLNGVKWLYPK